MTTTIPVGGSPQGVAITSDGAFAYEANTSGNSVSLIDIATNTVIRTPIVSSTFGPTCPAVTPDSASVYVVDENGAVDMISTATSTVAATVSLLSPL